MTEYGLFNDEGCVERQFYSVAGAETAVVSRYDVEDELEVLAMCGEHDEQPLNGCEECDSDEDDENDDEEES